jgi:hypothetical protein
MCCINPNKNKRTCFGGGKNSRTLGTCTLHSMVQHSGCGVYYLIHDNRTFQSTTTTLNTCNQFQSLTCHCCCCNLVFFFSFVPFLSFFVLFSYCFFGNSAGVVLVKGGMAAFYPSLYVDLNGEDVARVSSGKHRPLFLDQTRYDQLLLLIQTHGIGHAVSSIRSSSDGWIPMELL